MRSLSGKRALVTGAASGIGNAIAIELAQAGAEVFVLDRDGQAAETAATAIGLEHQVSCQALECDVADERSVEIAFEKVGLRLDILVNSAGIAHIGSVLTTSADDFDRLYRVNVRGTYLCMQQAARRMQAQRSGVIVNLASIAATTGLSDRFAYSMTKGAVLAMTLSAAKDLVASGIRCNCISPARIHTPFVDGFVKKTYPGREAEMLKTLSESQPIGRMGTPQEVAQLALFLCSEDSSFITGTDVLLDGGFTRIR